MATLADLGAAALFERCPVRGMLVAGSWLLCGDCCSRVLGARVLVQLS